VKLPPSASSAWAAIARPVLLRLSSPKSLAMLEDRINGQLAANAIVWLEDRRLIDEVDRGVFAMNERGRKALGI